VASRDITCENALVETAACVPGRLRYVCVKLEEEDESSDLYSNHDEEEEGEEEEGSEEEKEEIEETWTESEATTDREDTGKENHREEAVQGQVLTKRGKGRRGEKLCPSKETNLGAGKVEIAAEKMSEKGDGGPIKSQGVGPDGGSKKGQGSVGGGGEKMVLETASADWGDDMDTNEGNFIQMKRKNIEMEENSEKK